MGLVRRTIMSAQCSKLSYLVWGLNTNIMIKIIITTLFIASTYAYPYEEEREIGPPVEGPVPAIKPLTPELSNEVPFDAGAARANVKPAPEGSDLKTDATFWPFYRSYYSYPYYSYPRYRYYTPSVYYSYYSYW